MNGSLMKEERLVKKIGVKRVEYIESIAHINRNFTILDIKDIIEIYKEKVKVLKKSLKDNL